MDPAPGDFSFLEDSTAHMLSDAYATIERLSLWDFFRTQSPPDDKGYMFWSSPELTRLTKEMATANSHSGASWAFTMRNMQFIAMNGWERWVWSCQNGI